MNEMRTAEVREETVTDFANKDRTQTGVLPLTVKNAHRVILIRKKGTDEAPVPFLFRKKHPGMHNYTHLHGNPGNETELHPAEFKNWDAVSFKHPAYLEDLWEQACDAYRWSSFDPDIRGESDIMIYEEELHNDLKLIPEEKRDEYTALYRQKLSARITALSRCANPMVTGRSGFNCNRHEKAEKAYQDRYDDFRNWREKYMNTMQRTAEAARPEEEKREEAWARLKRDIAGCANTIHEIDTGKARGYDRTLFVSSILNKVSTHANHGEVEIVQKAVDFITEYNAGVKKPIITARNRFFRLPETAQRMREKIKGIKGQENKEVKFDGGTLVWNYGEDRLQILFDDIPEESKRKELKSSGFHWSPRNKAWQRQLNPNAVYASRKVLNLPNL